MMNRETLIMATAAILFVTFIAGWFFGWLILSMGRARATAQIESAAAQLRACEAARQQALAELDSCKIGLADAHHLLGEGRTEIEELRRFIDNQIKDRR